MPTLENLKAALKELNLSHELTQIEVKNSEQAAAVGFLGSPSILVNGHDLETGAIPETSSFSCRIYSLEGKKTGRLPTAYIKSRLQSLM